MSPGTINQLINAICSVLGQEHRKRLENKPFDDIVKYALSKGIDIDFAIHPIRELRMGDKQRTKGKTTIRVG